MCSNGGDVTSVSIWDTDKYIVRGTARASTPVPSDDDDDYMDYMDDYY